MQVSALWKIVIATIALGLFGFAGDSITEGGHWIVWTCAGAIYGLVCYPWFQELKRSR